jgi:hypothetical protein
MNASANNLGLVKSWLDIEIEFEIGIGPARWVVLWVFALACGLIPGGDWTAVQILVPIYFIAAYWHQSALPIKLGLAVCVSQIAFLNCNLPIPGLAWGYLSASAHWPKTACEVEWLLSSAAIYCGEAALVITLFHFLPRIYGWSREMARRTTPSPLSISKNRWSPAPAGAKTSLVTCSRRQTVDRREPMAPDRLIKLLRGGGSAPGQVRAPRQNAAALGERFARSPVKAHGTT